ncbi:hypothetical protein FRB99_002106 [Tulasnella sp. 403]|nr:hypothetical protein FRB99_002106 [Tulasnella sp. 403]
MSSASTLVGIGQIRRTGESSVSTASVKEMFPELEGKELQEQLEIVATRLEVENKIKDGAERILQLMEERPGEGKLHLRKEVEAQLNAARAKIASLSAFLDQIRGSPNSTRPRKKAAGLVNGKRNMFQEKPLQSTSGKQKDDPMDKDDFRTALNQAKQLIQMLISYRARFASHLQPSPMTYSPYSPAEISSAVSSTSPPPLMNERDMDRSRTGIMSALVTILQRNLRVRYELDIVELVRAIVPALADYASKESRAAAYRLIRHVILDAESIEKLQQFGLDWYMVRSLARDNKHAVEKEQVVKLIRVYVEMGRSRRSPAVGAGSGRVPLSEAVMRALTAVAEHPEDQFRHIALETLAEIDIDLIARTEGMRVLLQALADGPHEISPVLANAFLYLVDAPGTRAYLNPGFDLEIALTGFTDAYGRGSAHVERMKASSKVIATMLRSWSGLMYLCMDNMRAISSIINTLRIPSLEAREIVLDLFFEVLKIETPGWYQAYIDGRRLTGSVQALTPHPKTHMPAVIGTRSSVEATNGNESIDLSHSSSASKLNLTHQYIALLLLVFLEAGLLEALISILEEADPSANLPRKATLLLGELLQIANHVLPLNMAAHIQSLPRLFELAADTQRIDAARRVATATLSSIDSFNRNRARLRRPTTEHPRQRANSIEDTMRRNQRQVEQVKIKLSMQIDDKTFQDIIIKTQVMVNKEHTKWNMEALVELIEGPLMNPKRLEEAFRVTKFGKRLISFFHPFANRFSALRKTKANERYVRLGCGLLTTLLSCAEGVKFLMSEDPFLKQIVDCFNQLDPFNQVAVSDPIFSKERIADTLCYGYFEMLGILSKYPEGIELMERFKMFTSFYHISELKSREDLIKSIIENIDYTAGGHARIILSKALTSSYMASLHVRLFATTHLGQLIRSSHKANEWTLRLLLTQLYDPAVEVCELAVQYLEEACESMDVLELVVQMQPTLDHLGEVGHPLLLRFMSTTVGFRYLYKSGYIDREMDAWFHERNNQYAVQVEVYLARSFSSHLRDDDDDMLVFDGTVPPHFYGEMAKTELGCQVLSDKGHFAEFAHFIRQHGLESEDFDLIVKLKSVLWAVGNIGATTGGLPFLEEEGIIPNILDITETSLVMSVRGTAFFVLGLISSTTQGAELLAEYEWEATVTPLGETTGLCIPIDVAGFVQIPPWESPIDSHEPKWIAPPDDTMEAQILTAISNLQNTVIANEAARSLTRFKSIHRAIFSSIPLFYRVLHLLSTHRYRLPVRRYILDLFDIDLDPDVMATIYSLSTNLHRPVSPLDSLQSSKWGTGPNGAAETNQGLGLSVVVAEPRRGGMTNDAPTQTANGNGHHIPPQDPSARKADEEKEEPVTTPLSKNGGTMLTPMKRVKGFAAGDDSG